MASRCLLSRWRSSSSTSSSSSSSTAAAAVTNCNLLCFSYPVRSPHWRPHQSFFSSQTERLKEDEEARPWLQGAMDVSHPTYMVWGANTGVGKTLVSAGLSSAIFSQSRTCKSQGGADLVQESRRLDDSNEVLFVKPVQTGFPSDSDARFVFREVSRMAQLHPHDIPHGLFVSNHTLQVSSAVRRAVQKAQNSGSSDSTLDIGGSSTGMTGICSYESQLLQGLKFENSPQIFSETDSVVSNSSNGVDKDDIPTGRPRASQSHFTCKTVWAWSNPVSPHLASVKEGSAVPDLLVLDSLQSVLGSLSESPDKVIQRENTSRRSIRKWAIVETAGGVASPGPSGTLQCDLYRPLRFPGVLVGDGRLGGISTTIGAYESLCSRGYDIPAIVLVDAGLSNEIPLQQYLQHKIPVLVLPSLPQDPNENLAEWFAIAEETFSQLRNVLKSSHLKRLRRLEEMPKKASQILWWPFTQHDLVPEESITLIDSRLGDNFSVYKGGRDPRRDTISLQFDACASWWTQGPDASLQSELARAAAHAAGRYGHVMFPENVHEPALQCAELLLQGVGRGWADRVFYSDNGATAVEVAIKMAFRKYIIDHNLRNVSSKHNKQQFKVLALKGSYHGDTLGALEAQSPSAYTGFLQQPWYSGRGLFLEPPTVFQQDGRWFLNLPEGYSTSADIINSAWKCRDEVFDMGRNSTTLAKLYSEFIGQQLSSSAAREESTSIAALITEPVIHGAGGMEMLDPLFQRILVQECRKRCIPVIFDEVFSGCWRFGTESAAELLGCSPDIACYSKLLTGGVVPLSATLATKPVFEAFRGVSKLDALLHGHSYTAHAIGCSSAVAAIKYFSDPSKNANLLPDGRRLRELWSPELVSEISSHHAVHRVVSLGTIMALELRASSADGGYGSMISKRLVEGLRLKGIYTRPLGNVVYLMCGPLTHPETCRVLLQRLLTLLEDYPVREILQR